MGHKPRDCISLKWLSHVATGEKRLTRSYDFRFSSKFRRRLSKYLTLLLLVRVVTETLKFLKTIWNLLSELPWL